MSRRYRQKGYMDDDRPAERRGPKPPRERPEGPRGRGLGRPTESVFRCSRCGRERELARPLPPDAACAGCGDPLHACVNCLHFDTAERWECRREIPERIAGKRRANRCELFEARAVQVFAAEAPEPSAGKAAFDKLFDF